MEFADWHDTLLCYLSADSFEPETLKTRLQNTSGWSDEFRSAFEAALIANDFNLAEWQRDFNFHISSDQELQAWLRKVFEFLFTSGTVPNAPGQ